MVIYRKLSSKDNKVYYKRYIRCCCNSAIYNDTNEPYYKNNNYNLIYSDNIQEKNKFIELLLEGE